MSRFFDALKEAGRQSSADPREQWTASLETDNQASNGSDLKGEEFSILDAFPATSEATDGPPEQPAVEKDETSTELSGRSAVTASAGTENEAYPSKVQAHIDGAVPLLHHATNSTVVERYRRLRTKLLQQRETAPFRTLLIASPGPQEGKTVTALNLGLSFAMLPSFRVLIMDGDLRRGSLTKLIHLTGRPGLSDLIEGTARLDDVILKPDNMPVHFVGHGNSTAPRAELLHSPRLRSQLQRMAEHYDLVIVDSPPVNILTDSHVLAASCDAVLLVARAFSTTGKAMEQAISDLKGNRIVGTVFNGGARTQNYRRYDGRYDTK